MKNIVIGIVLLLNFTSAWAFDLKCQVKTGPGTDQIAAMGDSTFTIYDFDSKEPGISIDGGLFEAPSTVAGEYLLYFSNECDNMIEVKFNTRAMKKFNSKKTGTLSGKLMYSSAAFEGIKDGKVFARITCQ